MPQNITDLTDITCKQQPHVTGAKIFVERGQHPGRGHIDERDGFGVDYDGPDAIGLGGSQSLAADRVGVSEIKAALDSQNDDM